MIALQDSVVVICKCSANLLEGEIAARDGAGTLYKCVSEVSDGIMVHCL